MTLRVAIVGGSPEHQGGLEAYCERAEQALKTHDPGADWTWIRAGTAYVAAAKAPYVLMRQAKAAWKLRKCDLIWLQVSNFFDLFYLPLFRLLGPAILITPHFGAASRLQTSAVRRPLARRMMALAHRIGLLFDGQEREIDLPAGVPRETIGTFLPRAAQLPAEDQPRSDDKLIIVHAARFSEEKGTFRTVELCACLQRIGIPFEAKLVGRADEPIMRDLRAAIEHGGMNGDIEIIPWLDEERMIALLRRSDLLAHLSRLDSFPLIVLEALAVGTLPVILPMRGAGAMVEAFGGKVAETVEDAAEWIASQPTAQIRAVGREAAAIVKTRYGSSAIARRVRECCDRTLATEA